MKARCPDKQQETNLVFESLKERIPQPPDDYELLDMVRYKPKIMCISPYSCKVKGESVPLTLQSFSRHASMPATFVHKHVQRGPIQLVRSCIIIILLHKLLTAGGLLLTPHEARSDSELHATAITSCGSF